MNDDIFLNGIWFLNEKQLHASPSEIKRNKKVFIVFDKFIIRIFKKSYIYQTIIINTEKKQILNLFILIFNIILVIFIILNDDKQIGTTEKIFHVDHR